MPLAPRPSALKGSRGSIACLWQDEVHWDVETLRVLLQQMLKRSDTGPDDLMGAWDHSGDGQLSLDEFTQEVGVFFRGQQVGTGTGLPSNAGTWRRPLVPPGTRAL